MQVALFFDISFAKGLGKTHIFILLSMIFHNTSG